MFLQRSYSGFTLIELLVVIAILAVLATVVVVIINPAELLKQARDATRVADMAALNSAIALYMADVANPGSCSVFTAKCTHATTTAPFGVGGAYNCTDVNTTTTVDGYGWVMVDFTRISSGLPFPKLPLDPINSTSSMYAFACSGSGYKLGTPMESVKYANVQTGVTRNAYDGGTSASWYEVGNDLAL